MNIREYLSRPRSWQLLTLALMILVLTFIHQSGTLKSSPFQEIINIIPYLPIILGSLWFGFAGGMTCALLTSACYVTHLFLHEGGGFFAENFHRTLNILMFNVVGAVTGYLAHRQLKVMAGYRKLAAELEASYAELRHKTEELLRAEEHLQRANRLSVMGELTAGVAHEVGNPLGGIKGAAEILADGIDPGDNKHRFVRLLLQEVARLDSVVARFLDAVRPREAMEGPGDLSEVLCAVVSLCEQSLENGRLKLERKVEVDLPPVAADPHQLQQVFLNLLLNAIQATPPGGAITLDARRAGDAVECQVTDSGRGIPAENLPRLFDPFFTTRADGTGLGLAITHRILESCGGRIHVESEPGRGSTFTVTLRRSEEASVLEKNTHSR